MFVQFVDNRLNVFLIRTEQLQLLCIFPPQICHDMCLMGRSCALNDAFICKVLIMPSAIFSQSGMDMFYQ